ncbi:MAG: iron ABC transporter permease [Actinomycetaceae bacterium]|nr:iron ABC transporter permease [Arcanobacterium sp.]MDD7505528.1 iron ABC transporter permease [Actinomycetaceae bacterium]
MRSSSTRLAQLARRASWAVAIIIPLIFLAAFFVWPVGAMMLRGVFGGIGAGAAAVGTSGDGFSTIMGNLLASVRTWRIIWQTLWMAAAGTVFSVVLGVPGAYVLYCTTFPGRRMVRALSAVPFVLPTVTVGIAFRALLDGPLAFLGLSGTTTAVVMAMVFFNYSLVVRTVGNVWASLDPRLTQAARTLGASRARAFFTVTAPEIAPAVFAAGSLVFLFCSTAYGIVTTLGTPGYGTIETEIYIQTTTYFALDVAAALCVIQFVIVAMALVISAKLSARSDAALTIRTQAAKPLARSDAFPLGVVIATSIFIAAPLLTLLLRSFMVDGGWSVTNYALLGTSGAGFSGGATVWEAVEHSVRIALDSTLVSLLVGVPLAFVLSRRVDGVLAKAQRALDAFVLFPLGVSMVTIGFGFLLTFLGTPLGRSAWLVPLAQSVVALPLVVRSIVPLVRAIDPRLRDAAATLGAPPWRVLATIDVPFMIRGIGLSAGFAFAVSLGEFGATSFLANPNYQTLPVLIVKLLGRPGEHNYGMALAGSVILALITGVAMMVGESLSSNTLSLDAYKTPTRTSTGTSTNNSRAASAGGSYGRNKYGAKC